MLPKQRRLSTEDFKELKRSFVLHTPHFLVRLAPKTGASKAAAIVSTAISKRAVVRNRLRRRIYAVLQGIDCPQGYLTITAKRGAAELDYGVVKAELTAQLQKYALAKPGN